jgi:hypothetical protein
MGSIQRAAGESGDGLLLSGPSYKHLKNCSLLRLFNRGIITTVEK